MRYDFQMKSKIYKKQCESVCCERCLLIKPKKLVAFSDYGTVQANFKARNTPVAFSQEI